MGRKAKMASPKEGRGVAGGTGIEKERKTQERTTQGHTSLSYRKKESTKRGGNYYRYTIITLRDVVTPPLRADIKDLLSPTE